MSIKAANNRYGGILRWDILSISEQIPNTTVLNFPFRKHVVYDEIMNTTLVNMKRWQIGRSTCMWLEKRLEKRSGHILD